MEVRNSIAFAMTLPKPFTYLVDTAMLENKLQQGRGNGVMVFIKFIFRGKRGLALFFADPVPFNFLYVVDLEYIM